MESNSSFIGFITARDNQLEVKPHAMLTCSQAFSALDPIIIVFGSGSDWYVVLCLFVIGCSDNLVFVSRHSIQNHCGEYYAKSYTGSILGVPVREDFTLTWF